MNSISSHALIVSFIIIQLTEFFVKRIGLLKIPTIRTIIYFNSVHASIICYKIRWWGWRKAVVSLLTTVILALLTYLYLKEGMQPLMLPTWHPLCLPPFFLRQAGLWGQQQHWRHSEKTQPANPLTIASAESWGGFVPTCCGDIW